jgi:PAS domain-containing protein
MRATVVADRDGRFLDGNDEALELLGVSLGELRAARIGDFSGPHADQALSVWRRLTSVGADIPLGEATTYRLDGTKVRLRYTRFEKLPSGEFEMEFEPVADAALLDRPPVADHPAKVLEAWRAAEREADPAADHLRELFQESVSNRQHSPAEA